MDLDPSVALERVIKRARSDLIENCRGNQKLEVILTGKFLKTGELRINGSQYYFQPKAEKRFRKKAIRPDLKKGSN